MHISAQCTQMGINGTLCTWSDLVPLSLLDYVVTRNHFLYTMLLFVIMVAEDQEKIDSHSYSMEVRGITVIFASINGEQMWKM